jgi:hypothetical protein
LGYASLAFHTRGTELPKSKMIITAFALLAAVASFSDTRPCFVIKVAKRSAGHVEKFNRRLNTIQEVGPIARIDVVGHDNKSFETSSSRIPGKVITTTATRLLSFQLSKPWPQYEPLSRTSIVGVFLKPKPEKVLTSSWAAASTSPPRFITNERQTAVKSTPRNYRRHVQGFVNGHNLINSRRFKIEHSEGAVF